MIILGIETSCDETACAILKNDDNRITILSNIVASSAQLQAKFGGVIPEQAAREQIKSIIPVIEEALTQTFPSVNLWIPDQVRDDKGRIPPIDAIAVTYGPGLIGSLLVGVKTAKVLAKIWHKPLIPVNHLIGHFYANWISRNSSTRKLDYSRENEETRNEQPKFPCLGLLVSGGHTDLVLFTGHSKYKYLGGTRDDAAGECFDKCARLLGLPYPGGPKISKLASQGNALRIKLPRPMINSDNFDFSFSGLKTAVANLMHTSPVILSAAKNLSRMRDPNTFTAFSAGKLRDPSLIVQDDKILADLAAAIEQAIVDVLVAKTIKATQKYKVNQIMVAGGVAANQSLVSNLKFKISNLKLKAQLFVPPPHLCTDNAAMIAAAGFFQKETVDTLSLQADPNLSLS